MKQQPLLLMNGPLEFNGKGLEPIVTEIIKTVQKTKSESESKKMIIVIRETMVNDFLRKFKIAESEVKITKISRAF